MRGKPFPTFGGSFHHLWNERILDFLPIETDHTGGGARRRSAAPYVNVGGALPQLYVSRVRVYIPLLLKNAKPFLHSFLIWNIIGWLKRHVSWAQ